MARNNSPAAPAQEVSEEVDLGAEPVVTESADDFPAPEGAAEEPAADPEPEVPAAPEGAADAEEAPAGELEALATHIAMRHPDNGSCDRYEPDADGNLLVPVDDIALMLEHGFVPATAASDAV